MMMMITMERMPSEAEIGARGLALWTGWVRLAGWAAVVGRGHVDLHSRRDSHSPGHHGVLLVSGDYVRHCSAGGAKFLWPDSGIGDSG